MFFRFAPLVIVAALLPITASAIEYAVDIDVQTEEEITELEAQGDLSEEDRDALIELLQDGVDINSADRDDLYELPNITLAEVDVLLEYRQLNGGIDDPDQLVAAGVLDAEMVRKLKPFMIVSSDDRKIDLKGSAKLKTWMGHADDQPPPFSLNVRAKGLQGLRVGVLATTTRYRLGQISYDPDRERLLAMPAAYSLQVPKFYAQWNVADFSVLVGTYRVGFGERLTLDNSNRQRPSGFYADDSANLNGESRARCALSAGDLDADEDPCPPEFERTDVAPDFRWSDRFRGVAATAKNLRLGNTGAKLELTGFGSWQPRSVYQYHLYDRSLCEDPRSSDDDCGSIPVYVRDADPNADVPQYKFQTLTDVYDELAGGAHVLLTLPSHLKFGVVGWGASPQWRVPGVNLDVSPVPRTPFGGPFGAVGGYVAYGMGRLNLSAEVARSFDSEIGNQGGGWGVLQRSVLSAKRRELELTLRYYDKHFDNPYSRPVAGRDMVEGQLARNEAGVRAKYLDRAFQDWDLRGSVNFWVSPEETAPGTAGRSNLESRARALFRRYKVFQPYLLGDYTKNGLAEAAAATEEFICVEISDVSDDDSTGETAEALCAKNSIRAGAGVKLTPMRWLSGGIEYVHKWGDNGPRDRVWAEDRRITAVALVKPMDDLRVRARISLSDEDIVDPARGETELRSALEVSYWWMKSKLATRIRYDNYWLLDERTSTSLRVTNPWHLVRFEIEGRY